MTASQLSFCTRRRQRSRDIHHVCCFCVCQCVCNILAMALLDWEGGLKGPQLHKSISVWRTLCSENMQETSICLSSIINLGRRRKWEKNKFTLPELAVESIYWLQFQAHQRLQLQPRRRGRGVGIMIGRGWLIVCSGYRTGSQILCFHSPARER